MEDFLRNIGLESHAAASLRSQERRIRGGGWSLDDWSLHWSYGWLLTQSSAMELMNLLEQY